MGLIDSEDLHDLLETWMVSWEYHEPKKYYSVKRSHFLREVLDYWAATEVVQEVFKHSEMDPLDVLNEFRDRMDAYACVAKTDRAKDIFIALYDAANNAVDFLIGLRR